MLLEVPGLLVEPVDIDKFGNASGGSPIPCCCTLKKPEKLTLRPVLLGQRPSRQIVSQAAVIADTANFVCNNQVLQRKSEG